MARLYANENFPHPIVEELRKLGHDVLTIQETGKANQAKSDKEILGSAYAENRIVLTLNCLHFNSNQSSPLMDNKEICNYIKNIIS